MDGSCLPGPILLAYLYLILFIFIRFFDEGPEVLQYDVILSPFGFVENKNIFMNRINKYLLMSIFHI